MKKLQLRRQPEAKYLATKKVVIHFNRNVNSLEGYVIRETKNNYWLTKTKILTDKTEFELEGVQLVPRDDVFFLQVIAENAA